MRDTTNLFFSELVTNENDTNKTYNFSGNIPGTDIYLKQVIYSDPATIAVWNDGTKTICKCVSPDIYDKPTGLMLCVLKKIFGTTGTLNLLNDWLPEQQSILSQTITLKDVIKKNK